MMIGTGMSRITKMLTLGFVAPAAWLMAASLQTPAQAPCDPQLIARYLETIKSERVRPRVGASRLKSAIDCAVQVAPSKETAQVLISRLDLLLQATRRLTPNWPPIYEGEIVAALTDALYALNISEGYEKIAAYFASADWNTRRDQGFFGKIQSRVKHKSELIETYYLALMRMQPNRYFYLGEACSMFVSGRGPLAGRREPRFLRGALAAVTRIEQEKADFLNKEPMRLSCEKALVSQLLDGKSRQAFLASHLEQLSQDERRVLDRFLATTAPPVADVVAQFIKGFFAVPWKLDLSTFQSQNPQSSCEPFRGETYVTHAEDLWCVRCVSQRGPFEESFYFYPDTAGSTCTLQRARMSHPTAIAETLSAVTEELGKRMGPGRRVYKVQERGAGYWEDIAFWQWQGREVHVFRNKLNPKPERGAPPVEILATNQELLSTMKREEAAEQAIEKEQEQRAAEKKHRLYRDVAESLPDLIQRLEKAPEPESQYLFILELLSKIAEKGPHRAAQLYLADRLVGEIGDPTNLGKLKDWERKKQALSAYGVVYSRYKGEIYSHNHVFLRKIVEKGLTDYWADEAFLEWLVMGIGEEYGKDYSCERQGRFERVVTRGEDFLIRNPTTHIRKDLLLALAEAHETAWSLSLARPEEENGFVRAKKYQVGAQNHRQKAMSYYQQFIKEFLNGSHSVLARERLKRLRLGVDTNARHFFYTCH